MRPQEMLRRWRDGDAANVLLALAESAPVMAVASALALHDDLRKQCGETAADNFRHACYGEALYAAGVAKETL